MLKKLRIKFICINMTIVTVMLLVIFGLVYHFTKESLESESIRMMEAIATSPPQLGNLPAPSDEVKLPYFSLRFDQDGELLNVGGGYYDLSDDDFLQNISQAAMNSEKRIGVLEEYQLRYYRSDFMGWQQLVFADISSEQTTLSHLIQTCAGIGVLSFLIFFGISLLLARWAVKPVEHAWQQQRQFVADASHELKTPLTVILSNAQLLQAPETSEFSHHTCRDNILTMATQMRRLIEHLLDLARIDNGSARANMQKINWTDLIADGLLLFEPLYFEKNLVLTEELAPNITVKGNEMYLQQVLDILLDNAMKYSVPHAMVQISLIQQGHHALLSVANPGPTIPAQDLPHIFERFYRTDKARSQNGSYGLGLSIAQKIVEEHGGKIWVTSADEMTTFFVSLPLYKSK